VLVLEPLAVRGLFGAIAADRLLHHLSSWR
jgi:hypothetical protein